MLDPGLSRRVNGTKARAPTNDCQDPPSQAGVSSLDDTSPTTRWSVSDGAYPSRCHGNLLQANPAVPDGWVLLPECPEFVGRAAFIQRTACIQVRQQHFLFRVQNFGGFCHEVHSAENDCFGIGLRGFSCLTKRIANVIRDLLDRIDLIIMTKQDGVFLLFESNDFLLLVVQD